MEKIRLGIVGYGNLGKGVERAVRNNPDMEIVGVFTRRDPATLDTANMVYAMDNLEDFVGKVDVMILCGGSATDLPKQTKTINRLFNTVDSYDNHAEIPGYFAEVDRSAKECGKVSMISIGWDPGLFSLNRVLANAVLPSGKDYTFWGEGVSQGHSDAIRRVPGVVNAIQYTVPVESALQEARSGSGKDLTAREKHTRLCFVVAEEGADKDKIAEEIRTMPNYFEPYDTTVNFITEEELARDHGRIPHGGFVIRTGETSKGVKQNIEFRLKLDSNPEFTSSVLVAYARACYRFAKEGKKGAFTVLDVPFAAISPKSGEDLRRDML
jgi:diaminopimelate dehydrogenase